MAGGPRAFMLPRGRVKYAAVLAEPDLLRSGNAILVRIGIVSPPLLSFFSLFYCETAGGSGLSGCGQKGYSCSRKAKNLPCWC